MTRESPASSAPVVSPNASGGVGGAFLPLLLILFVCSGCSALIYEIVWFQLLQFAIGSSAVSMAVLLGTFMGGMCLGSLLFGRFVSPKRHPLRIYACLELGVGILGLLISSGMPRFDSFYGALAHVGGSGLAMRAVICVICLLPPTLLMGATLPAIARWVENTPRGASWLGFFYGGNTVGAVAGSLLAGFYLLREFDMYTATHVAVGLNVLVGLAGIALSFACAGGTASAGGVYGAMGWPEGGDPPGAASGTAMLEESAIYVAIGLSGMAALGGEVIWTRLLSLLLGGTVYTFSIILAVFLAGLGAGSSIGAMIARTGANARVALAWSQALCTVCIAWTAYAVTNGLPNWPVNPYMNTGLSGRFALDLARCCWAILPPALFWGASFPLALAAVIHARPQRDPAKSVGRAYAANTLGAIAGSLFFALIAVRTWGSTASQHIQIALAGLAAVISMVPGLGARRGDAARVRRGMTQAAIGILCAAILASGSLVVLTSTHIDALPWQLVAWGRRFRAFGFNPSTLETTPNEDLYNGDARLVYMGEGLNSSVAVTSSDPEADSFTPGQDTLSFHVAGKVEASTELQDMRLQLMLGHYPALFHANPEQKKKVLIVGCGAGVTAGCFMLHKDYEKIVICEIEPLVPKLAGQYFSLENNSVVTPFPDGKLDPRVHLIDDDARHYILTTDEKYDVVTSDPIHPWVKGAATLYSKEYFELVKKHLNPGGLVTQWVPLYESNIPAVKSEIKTFFSVFSSGTIWCNDENGEGYDLVLMGSNEPMVIDQRELQSRMDLVISGILGRVKLGTATDILKTYGGRASDLEDWTSAGQINSDQDLRLEYLAGEALNNFDANDIQDQILRRRRWPEDLIKAPESVRSTIEKAWEGGKR